LHNNNRQLIFKRTLHVTVAGVFPHVTPGLPLRSFSTQICIFQSTWASRFNCETSC